MIDFSLCSVVAVISCVRRIRNDFFAWIRAPRYICVAGAMLWAYTATCANAQESAAAPPVIPAKLTHNETAWADLTAYPEAQHFLELGQFDKALAVMLSDSANHDNDPQYLNLIGILSMKVRDYPAAVSALEQVVLMQPDNAGAWLDLGLASAKAGNICTGVGYFDFIEKQFAPPMQLRQLMAPYRQHCAANAQAAAPSAARWQFNAEAGTGYDSNANSGLQRSVIPLTFASGPIDFPIDPAFQAQGDHFVQAGASADYKYSMGIYTFELLGGALEHSYRRLHDFSTLDLNLGGGVHWPTSLGELGLWMSLEHIDLGGKGLMLDKRTSAQIERPLAGCHSAFGAELEWRRFVSLSQLDADLLWGQARLACDWTIRGIPLATTLTGRLGADVPVNNRPGGRIGHGELTAQAGALFGNGVRLDFSFSLAAEHDADGYSPNLENNAARWLLRRATRMQLCLPVNKSTDLTAVIEENRYHSNLPLFQQGGQSVGIGLRKRF
jgi:tetratricopeptide (TPR) repeat protein